MFPVAQQQQRLLDARFGPREVESLAINAIVPAFEDAKEEGEEDDGMEGVPGGQLCGGEAWPRCMKQLLNPSCCPCLLAKMAGLPGLFPTTTL